MTSLPLFVFAVFAVLAHHDVDAASIAPANCNCTALEVKVWEGNEKVFGILYGIHEVVCADKEAVRKAEEYMANKVFEGTLNAHCGEKNVEYEHFDTPCADLDEKVEEFNAGMKTLYADFDEGCQCGCVKE
ncbi:hypothetical protein QR680_008949 [Steinernema hermaphroditum]|uniref:Pepsin inhibitor-3-like repeated domain-containing protein n=1 Tax=Steinernema hermaphroditum TaxID=289476 RepID=A0AA39IKE6_9BILA|nr:hypothetical protein QR680_008949 [Steinernema hermaphroditum]